MAQPHPSLTLLLDLDERLVSEDVRLEVGRCYAHVGQALVRTHPAPEDGAAPVNTMRMLVKLGTRRYLDSAVEGADELWDGVIERWIYNEFHKVGNNMKIYNRRQREIGGTELVFDWIEVQLENGALNVELHLDSNSDIAPACAGLIGKLRTLRNEGAFGAEVVRVQMPTPESYAAQREQGLAAKAEREAAEEEARAAAAAEEKAAQEAAEAAADEAFLESPALVAAEEDADRASEEEIQAELEAKYGFPEPDFTIDYTLWAVHFADGTVKTFDSLQKAFI